MTALGRFIKARRMALQNEHSGFSIRALARRINIHPSYLSKLERGDHAPLSEERIIALARELGEDEDVLLGVAGRLSERVQNLVARNPQRFLDCVAGLESEVEAEESASEYTRRLEHRKHELEVLTRRLRDEIKARQALEERLVQAKAEKLAILSNLKDVVVEYIDKDFNLLWASPAIQNYLSCSLEQAVGQPCYRVVMGRTEACAECTALEALRTGMVVDGTRKTADGRHWLVRSVPIKGESGAVDKVVHFGFDVTELERARGALAESEQRWRFALEGAQEGVWDWNKAADTVFYSRRWKEMLGYAEDEIGTSLAEWDARIHPDDYRGVYAALNAHIDGLTPEYTFEHRLRCKDGSYKWILDRGMIVERDAEGTPLRAIGTHFDVTAQHDAQEQIRHNEAFLQALLGSIQEGITVLDRDLRIVYANSVQERRHSGELPLVGKKCYQTFHGTDQPCADCPSLRCMTSRRAESRIAQIAMDGGVRSYELFCYPILDPYSGDVSGVVEFVRDITDKLTLDTRQSLFAAVVENTANMCVIKDLNLRVIAANAAFAAVANAKDPKDLIGRTDAEIFGVSEDMAPVKGSMEDDRLAQTFAPGQVLDREEELVFPDGQTHVMHARTFPVFNSAGTLIATATISTDISTKVLARREMEAAQRRHAAMIDNAPLGICSVLPNGEYLSVNAAQATLHGYANPQDMLARVRHAREVFADPADWERLTGRLGDQNVVSGFEAQARRQDGGLFWTSRTACVVRGAQGAVVRYDMFMRDIQDSKAAQVLAEKNRQVLAILEQLEAGVYVLDPRTRHIMYANPYLERAMGHPLEGLQAHVALLKNAENCSFCLVADEGAAPQMRTKELLFANDRWYYCTAKTTQWLDAGQAVLVVATDITALKQAEAMREDTDRILRHDLRNPLGAMIAIPQLVAESTALGAEDRDMLLALSDSARRMYDMIEASLSLYRVETGQYQLRRGELSLEREIARIRRELTQELDAKRITVRVVCADLGVATLRGDVVLLPFVLSNLVRNAVEAAPQDSVVTVRLEQRGGQWLSVHNLGVVPEHIRDRFFEKYVTYGKAHGTGLGTYSALRIAEAHGGSAQMRTADDEGTTVTLFLP